MKKSFRNALLSTAVVLASFGSVANSYAQVPPVAPAPVSFVAALNPIFNLISAMNHRSVFMLIRATEIGNRLTTLVVHANQLVANTNAMNANLNAINANILNISNKNNDSSASIKEIRDHLIDDAGAVFPDGLGGLSNIPWFNTEEFDLLPRNKTNKKLAELYAAISKGEEYLESPGLTTAIEDLIQRYNLEEALINYDRFSEEDKKNYESTKGVLISSLLAAGVAERTFNRSHDSLGRLQAYLDALQRSNSIKTSLDINTRVLIELTQTTNENIKMLAAANSAQSQEKLVAVSDSFTGKE